MDIRQRDRTSPEKHRGFPDDMTQNNMFGATSGTRTPLLGPNSSSHTGPKPSAPPYDEVRHSHGTVRIASSVSNYEADQLIDYGGVTSKNHATQLLEKTGYRKRFENSWKAAKRFTQSQTIILSGQNSIEVDDVGADLKCSNCETLMNLLKGYTGPAILSMPWVFRNSGLWLGLAVFLFIAFLSVYCVHLIVASSVILEKRTGFHVKNYEDVVEFCFSSGPKRLQKLASVMRRMVTIMLQVMQCGFCCFYIIFVASNVKKIVDGFWMENLDIRVYEILVSILLLPFAFVKSLKSLAIVSVLGILMYTMAMVIIFQYILQDLPDVRDRPAFSSWSTLPLFFGTSLFCFEGLGVVVPLRNRMKHPEDFGGFAGVLNLGLVLATVLLTAAGFYGYLKFGDEVAATLTLNLPHDQWLYLCVDAIFPAVALLSFGLQFYVPVNAIRPWLEGKIASEKWRSRAHYFLRIGLFLPIFIVSIVVPHLELVTSLIGAMFGGLLIIILPAVIDTITQYEDEKLTRLVLLRNLVIIVFGVLGLVTGTYTSLIEIVSTF